MGADALRGRRHEVIVFRIDDIIAISILAVIGVLLLATLVKEWASGFLDWLKDVFG